MSKSETATLKKKPSLKERQEAKPSGEARPVGRPTLISIIWEKYKPVIDRLARNHPEQVEPISRKFLMKHYKNFLRKFFKLKHSEQEKFSTETIQEGIYHLTVIHLRGKKKSASSSKLERPGSTGKDAGSRPAGRSKKFGVTKFGAAFTKIKLTKPLAQINADVSEALFNNAIELAWRMFQPKVIEYKEKYKHGSGEDWWRSRFYEDVEMKLREDKTKQLLYNKYFVNSRKVWDIIWKEHQKEINHSNPSERSTTFKASTEFFSYLTSKLATTIPLSSVELLLNSSLVTKQSGDYLIYKKEGLEFSLEKSGYILARHNVNGIGYSGSTMAASKVIPALKRGIAIVKKLNQVVAKLKKPQPDSKPGVRILEGFETTDMARKMRALEMATSNAPTSIAPQLSLDNTAPVKGFKVNTPTITSLESIDYKFLDDINDMIPKFFGMTASGVYNQILLLIRNYKSLKAPANARLHKWVTNHYANQIEIKYKEKILIAITLETGKSSLPAVISATPPIKPATAAPTVAKSAMPANPAKDHIRRQNLKRKRISLLSKLGEMDVVERNFIIDSVNAITDWTNWTSFLKEEA